MRRVRFRDPAGTIRNGQWAKGALSFAGRAYDAEEVDVLPPVSPTKLIGVGFNYVAHNEELDTEIPEDPFYFMMSPNTVSGHEDTVHLPEEMGEVIHEGEIGVVIGSECRGVSVDEALESVEGYTCINDITNLIDPVTEGGLRDYVRIKTFDNSTPIGPVVASPDEVPEDAFIKLRVNGDTRQHSSMADLRYSVSELIADLSTYMTLLPGDVISTGSPGGVGPLEDGDTVEVEMDGVGVLRHYVER